VIIFDDDLAIGQLFKRYLSKHEVVISRSLNDMLALAQTIRPSAVVLDQNRYNADLEAFLAQNSPETAIIYCPMPSERRAVQAYGAADYLVKPITRQALIGAVVGLGKSVEKILVIDDERDVTRMLSHMFEAHDQRYTVWQANNAEEGLAVMHREIPDVVVLDIQMPGMDGFRVLDQMKRHPLLQPIPVIIASARGAGGAITSSIEGDITMVRPNGFNLVELVNCVESLVNVLVPSSALTPQ
jgi:CheY-like chemotaxis protein